MTSFSLTAVSRISTQPAAVCTRVASDASIAVTSICSVHAVWRTVALQPLKRLPAAITRTCGVDQASDASLRSGLRVHAIQRTVASLPNGASLRSAQPFKRPTACNNSNTQGRSRICHLRALRVPSKVPLLGRPLAPLGASFTVTLQHAALHSHARYETVRSRPPTWRCHFRGGVLAATFSPSAFSRRHSRGDVLAVGIFAAAFSRRPFRGGNSSISRWPLPEARIRSVRSMFPLRWGFCLGSTSVSRCAPAPHSRPYSHRTRFPYFG